MDVRWSEEAATLYTKINVSADFSDKICEDMGWNPMSFIQDLSAPLQKGIKAALAEHGNEFSWVELAGLKGSVGLKGLIEATTMELLPSGLKEHNLSLNVNEVRNFKMVRLLTKEGKTKSVRLDFQIITASPEAPQEIAGYLAAVGHQVGQMKIGYAKQENLKLDASGDDEEETEEQDEPNTPGALASVAEMTGRRKRTDVQ